MRSKLEGSCSNLKSTCHSKTGQKPADLSGLKIFTKAPAFCTILSFLILALVTISCDNDLFGSDDPVIEAIITVEDINPPVGVPVELDGSQSVHEGDETTFSWNLNAPEGSSSAIEDPSAEITSFVPDMEGDFLVTLTLTSSGLEDSQTVTIAAGGSDVEVSGSINEDVILYSENRYLVTGDIVISNGTLTIQPGTEIRFNQGTHMRISSNGIIDADGTEEDQILFTGTNESRGWWNGIHFQGSTHPNNLLNNVIIEYGGGSAHHGSVQPANLTIGRSLHDGSVTLTNSIVRHSGGFGLFIHSNGAMPNSGNNRYTENTSGPAGVFANVINYLDSESEYTGNDTGSDAVEVTGNSVNQNVTWQALDVPYHVYGDDISILGGDIAIEPGSEFAFDAQKSIRFESELVISIVGTEDNPIIFTGIQKTAGWWDGVFVRNTSHPNNTMEHVIIEYGGRSAFHGSTKAANLTIGRSLNSGSVSLKNSTIRNSGGVGVFIHTNSSMPNSESNSYTGNVDGPAEVATTGAHYFDSNSSYTGNNGKDFVWVTGDSFDRSTVWQALNVPYGLKGISAINDGEFSIEPGAVLAFDAGAGLTLEGDVVFSIVGTDQDPILFTAIQEDPGWWRGVYVRNTMHPNNIMENVIIEYGGSEAIHGSVEPANLTVGRSLNNARMVLTGSTLRNSSGHGIYVHGNSQINSDVCSVNTFEGNANSDCVVEE